MTEMLRINPPFTSRFHLSTHWNSTVNRNKRKKIKITTVIIQNATLGGRRARKCPATTNIIHMANCTRKRDEEEEAKTATALADCVSCMENDSSETEREIK